MKRIFSIIIPMLLLGSGIALALTAQDESICSERDHMGYTYDGPNEAPAAPLNPSEDGLDPLGEFEKDFECAVDENKQCHWAYITPTLANPDGRWVECSGEYQEIENP